MTAIMMASMGAAAVTLAPLDTTVTVGQTLWFYVGGSIDEYFYNYGYGDGTASETGIGTAGSIGDDTYTDSTSTTRTVAHIYYAEDTFGIGSAADDDSIYFGLSGTSIPNTDDTFVQIEYNGQVYTRASADVYTASEGGVNTTWQWRNVVPDGPKSGTVDFKVIL